MYTNKKRNVKSLNEARKEQGKGNEGVFKQTTQPYWGTRQAMTRRSRKKYVSEGEMAMAYAQMPGSGPWLVPGCRRVAMQDGPQSRLSRIAG